MLRGHSGSWGRERLSASASDANFAPPTLHVWLRHEPTTLAVAALFRDSAQSVSRNASGMAGLREMSFSLDTDEVIKIPGLSWSLDSGRKAPGAAVCSLGLFPVEDSLSR